MFDQMHTLDLGTHQCMVPSVLRDLVEKPGVFEGQTRGGRLNKAYVKYRKWCKDNQIRSVVRSKFRVDIWCKNKYPQITQLQAKAAALRSMTYWLKGICNRNTTTDHDKVRALMVSGFCDADVQCRNAGRFFTRVQHARMCDALEKALVAYNYLAEESIRLETYNFKMIPKFHASSHSFDSFWNPRASHCYADEDMVGRLKKIYCNCHGSTASKRALQRYAIVVCTRWWAAEHELRNIRFT